MAVGHVRGEAATHHHFAATGLTALQPALLDMNDRIMTRLSTRLLLEPMRL